MTVQTPAAEAADIPKADPSMFSDCGDTPCPQPVMADPRNEAAVQESAGNKIPLGGIPPESHRRRFSGVPPVGEAALRDERIARSLVLGICPIFLLTTGLRDEELLPFAAASEEERVSLAAALPGAIHSITG